MKQYDVLIVEDDIALCEALCDTLEIEGYRVISAKNGIEALSQLAKYVVRLVVSDVQMPVMDGFQLLQNIQQKFEQLPVLLMTAYGTIPKAVEAMQSGAADYLIKPFEAGMLVDKVASLITLQAPVVNERVVADECMKKLYALASKVARTDVTMLLEGESGTGKEVLARYVHRNSHYHAGPFEAINCAAIPENMLEAMLFGYEKGAFTGAIQSAPGKFELAQGGTLLLDEISEMDISLQAKLLRVLQEKEVERLGSHRKIALNVRILATTNRKLKDYVHDGRFREDLYFRLSVFPLRIPPLRERPGDILPLALELLNKHSPAGKAVCSFDDAAMIKLSAYSWPGNVRELENVVQRALILQSRSQIGADDLIFEEDMLVLPSLPAAVQSLAVESRQTDSVNSQFELGSLGDGVRSAEEKIILQMLRDVSGSRKTTAAKLGISPRTLRYKIARMKEAGVMVPG
ncbi:sigma-54-dependent Fis family transcriptional regulator [Methylomonas methanica]|uniref:Sigma-54-dependent Fis family transcriptional regulator n=1 Tax=Methylomonas methanica TaxID=421 RepID=A0A177M1F6_METMH|nr:sigma-54 dependent transcriptional regulator [Methylomonas methanica]OAH99525.1 sigma-54-dependent Fis family transcriptional regulator [Methylomonas methanica]